MMFERFAMSLRYGRRLLLIAPNLADADKGKAAWQGADKPDDLNQKVKRNLCPAMMLIPISFAISATLVGCGGVVFFSPPQQFFLPHIRYTPHPPAAPCSSPKKFPALF